MSVVFGSRITGVAWSMGAFFLFVVVMKKYGKLETKRDTKKDRRGEKHFTGRKARRARDEMRWARSKAPGWSCEASSRRSETQGSCVMTHRSRCMSLLGANAAISNGWAPFGHGAQTLP